MTTKKAWVARDMGFQTAKVQRGTQKKSQKPFFYGASLRNPVPTGMGGNRIDLKDYRTSYSQLITQSHNSSV